MQDHDAALIYPNSSRMASCIERMPLEILMDPYRQISTRYYLVAEKSGTRNLIEGSEEMEGML